MVPIVVGSTLSNQAETVPSSGRAVGLLVPGKLVLETATNPARFELGKVTVLVNLDSENPATGQKINIATKLGGATNTTGPEDFVVFVVVDLSWQPKHAGPSTKLSWTRVVMLHMQLVQLNLVVQFFQHPLRLY